MLFNSIFLVLNFLSLLLILYTIIKKNRKLSEKKIKSANLEANLCKLEHELQEAKQALTNKDKEIVGLKVNNAELEVTLQKEHKEKKKK
ncbi:MAG: hypothetical protein ACR5K2_00670 [Wolbachia sp.]